jgi:hypothetical protein
MTVQIPDTVVLCGHRFEVEELGYLPPDHPAITDFSKLQPDGPHIRLAKCSALDRGYMADWEIRDDGRLYLTSLTRGYHLVSSPLFADWVSSTVSIPVGEIDDTRSRVLQYELVREMALELQIIEGVIKKWRLVKGSHKGIRWKSGFDWSKITAMLAAEGISSDFQPPPSSHSEMFSRESLPIIAQQSAALLQRARLGDTNTGKVLTEANWNRLRRGWADPFPKLDFHDTVRSLRGHGPPLKKP